MYTNFFDQVFQDNEPWDFKIPEELQRAIDNDLPEGFTYKKVGKDIYAISPKDKRMNIRLNIKTPDRIKELLDLNEEISGDDIAEYFYNSQKIIEIKSEDETVEINGESIKIADLIDMPFRDIKKKNSKLFITPPKMNETYILTLSDGEYEKKIKFIRVPNDDIFIKKFTTKDDALEISALVNVKNNNSKFNIGVDVTKANCVNEVISTYFLVRAIINNKICVNGLKIELVKNNQLIPPPDKVLSFWKKAKEVEKRIKKTFSLKNGVTKNDAENILALHRTLIERKPYKKYCDSLFLKGNISGEEKFLDAIDNADAFYFEYSEVIKMELLGQELILYSLAGIFNSNVSDKEVLDDKKNYSIKLTNAPNKRLYRSFIYFLDEIDEETLMSSHRDLLENAIELEEVVAV